MSASNRSSLSLRERLFATAHLCRRSAMPQSMPDGRRLPEWGDLRDHQDLRRAVSTGYQQELGCARRWRQRMLRGCRRCFLSSGSRDLFVLSQWHVRSRADLCFTFVRQRGRGWNRRGRDRGRGWQRRCVGGRRLSQFQPRRCGRSSCGRANQQRRGRQRRNRRDRGSRRGGRRGTSPNDLAPRQ